MTTDPWLLTLSHGFLPLRPEPGAWQGKLSSFSKPPLHSWDAMWIPLKSLENHEIHKRKQRNHVNAMGQQDGSSGFFMQTARDPSTHVCVLKTKIMKKTFFFFGAARFFCLWNQAKSMFFNEKAQLELPTPHHLHPPPLIYKVFSKVYSRTRTKKTFSEIPQKTGVYELPGHAGRVQDVRGERHHDRHPESHHDMSDVTHLLEKKWWDGLGGDGGVSP